MRRGSGIGNIVSLMPQAGASESFVTMLPNGNRVTVNVGWNGSGTFKTVIVIRPDGSTSCRTYRRGRFASRCLKGIFSYRRSVPQWAKSGPPTC